MEVSLGSIRWRVTPLRDDIGPLEGFSCADADGDGVVSVLDVGAFLAVWAAGAASADLDGDGRTTPLDLRVFLDARSRGCRRASNRHGRRGRQETPDVGVDLLARGPGAHHR